VIRKTGRSEDAYVSITSVKGELRRVSYARERDQKKGDGWHGVGREGPSQEESRLGRQVSWEILF